MIAAADYQFLSQFLLKYSGLSLGAGKEYLLEARLHPVLRSAGLNNLADLVTKLRRLPNSSLATAVIEAMTTNETLFFRDKTPFDELRELWLPRLIDSRRPVRQLRIWSAAAATGQEAYSLSMLLHDAYPELRAWNVEILGTDLSTAALARARTGVYSQFEVQRGLPIQMLVKHFDQVSGGWQIKQELRRHVKFERRNLLEPFHQLGLFDVILCRNVLIYFDSETKRQILDRMAKQLRPEGPLILGAAETTIGITTSLERLSNCRSSAYGHAARSQPHSDTRSLPGRVSVTTHFQ